MKTFNKVLRWGGLLIILYISGVLFFLPSEIWDGYFQRRLSNHQVLILGLSINLGWMFWSICAAVYVVLDWLGRFRKSNPSHQKTTDSSV